MIGNLVAIHSPREHELHTRGLHGWTRLPKVIEEARGQPLGVDQLAQVAKGDELGLFRQRATERLAPSEARRLKAEAISTIHGELAGH